jgi:hypothetical protein
MSLSILHNTEFENSMLKFDDSISYKMNLFKENLTTIWMN